MIPPDVDGRSDTRRRQRRRLFALPLVAVLLAVSLKLVTMSWFSTRGVAAYDDASYDRSASEFDRLQVFNVIEPWRAHLGSGTALHRDDDLEGAEFAFRRALELAPQRCDVRFNLVVTIEAQGDRLTGGEQREVEESELQDGLARYRVALDIADAGLCPTSTAGDAGTRLDEARQRLRAKLGAETSGTVRSWKRRSNGTTPTGRARRATRSRNSSPNATRPAPPSARTTATSTPPRSRTRERPTGSKRVPGAGVTPAGRRATSLG